MTDKESLEKLLKEIAAVRGLLSQADEVLEESYLNIQKNVRCWCQSPDYCMAIGECSHRLDDQEKRR